MDWVRFGLLLRALRRERRMTQEDAAAKARVSQAAVSRAERGDAGLLTGRTLGQIAEALGGRYLARVVWQGEGLDRLLDAAHAGLVDQVIEILVANGWEVVPEATFNRYGERGSIDILAWHPGYGALLIVEVKSVVPDMQAMLAGVDRKVRIGPELAAARGWDVRSVSRLIVLPEDRTVRRRLADHAATLGVAYPARSREVRRWMATPDRRVSGLLVLPSSRRTTARHRIGRVRSADGGPTATKR